MGKAPWIAVAGLWHVGRRYAAVLPGGWLAAPGKNGEDAGLVLTADTIVRELDPADLHRALVERDRGMS